MVRPGRKGYRRGKRTRSSYTSTAEDCTLQLHDKVADCRHSKGRPSDPCHRSRHAIDADWALKKRAHGSDKFQEVANVRLIHPTRSYMASLSVFLPAALTLKLSSAPLTKTSWGENECGSGICSRRSFSVVGSVRSDRSLCHILEEQKRFLAQRLASEFLESSGHLPDRRHL